MAAKPVKTATAYRKARAHAEATVSRIDDTEELADLAQNSFNPNIRHAAKERLGTLVAAGKAKPTYLHERKPTTPGEDTHLPPLSAIDTEAEVDRRLAAAQLLRIQEANNSFAGFVTYMHHHHGMPGELHAYPQFEIDLMKKLDEVERGLCKRLLICMPPRTCKSTFGTHLFPAYFFGRNPLRHIISASYNETLASDFGRKVRRVINDPLYQQAFPNTQISSESKSATHFETTKSGAYSAIGIGGTATGRGANLLIIDDPIKNRKEAESPTVREYVWSEYIDSLHSRLEQEKGASGGISPDARIIVILTRWHVDDLAGRLMRSTYWARENWQYIEVKALLGDPGKERSFWPTSANFELSKLITKRDENPASFASLYQQQPYVQGGNLIKEDWWRYYEVTHRDGIPQPSDQTVRIQSIIVSWDTAFQAKTRADFSVAQVWALATNGDIYLLEQWRDKVDFPTLKRRAIRINNFYRGKGLIGHYIEDRASGQSLIQELRAESGVAVVPYRIPQSTDKVARLQSVIGLIEGGRIFLPSNTHFIGDFLEEARAFPNATHDDQIDALTIGLDILSKQSLANHDLFAGQIDLAASLTNQVANRTGIAQPISKDSAGLKRGGFFLGQ